jgi:TPR repeat protein
MTGMGVTRDYAEAYFWLDLAASGNTHKPEEVAKDRDNAASHLSNVRLLQIQERARKWFEEHPARP